MNINSLETTDIYRGAFFLCNGSDLNDIRFKNNGRKVAYFLFTGANLLKLDKAYRNGQSLVDPVRFKESLCHLRDMLSEKQNYIRGDRHDRKRKNRGHKKRY